MLLAVLLPLVIFTMPAVASAAETFGDGMFQGVLELFGQRPAEAVGDSSLMDKLATLSPGGPSPVAPMDLQQSSLALLGLLPRKKARDWPRMRLEALQALGSAG